jgi:hypothetical protein
MSDAPHDFRTLRILRVDGRTPATEIAAFLQNTPILVELCIHVEHIPAESWEYLLARLNPESDGICLVPKLEVLRIATSLATHEAQASADSLLAMVEGRFRQAPTTPTTNSSLRSFSLHSKWINPTRSVSPLIFNGLNRLREQKGWDVQVHDIWAGGFWTDLEEMGS